MSYMSYCKFEGTRTELQSCIGTVCEHIDGVADYEVSQREIRYFKRIVEDMAEFFRDNNLLDEDGYVNEDELETICDLMARGCEEDEEYED